MKINPSRCPQNHKCPAMGICSVGAITQSGVGLPKIDSAKCIDCGKCISFCPRRAIGK